MMNTRKVVVSVRGYQMYAHQRVIEVPSSWTDGFIAWSVDGCDLDDGSSKWELDGDHGIIVHSRVKIEGPASDDSKVNNDWTDKPQIVSEDFLSELAEEYETNKATEIAENLNPEMRSDMSHEFGSVSIPCAKMTKERVEQLHKLVDQFDDDDVDLDDVPNMAAFEDLTISEVCHRVIDIISTAEKRWDEVNHRDAHGYSLLVTGGVWYCDDCPPTELYVPFRVVEECPGIWNVLKKWSQEDKRKAREDQKSATAKRKAEKARAR